MLDHRNTTESDTKLGKDASVNCNCIKPKFHYTDFATKSGTSCRGHKSWKSVTQITSPTFTICVCDLSWTLSPTFPMHCNWLNSIRATQTGLSRTYHELCRKQLNMSRWFVSTTFPAGKFRWMSA